MSTAFYPLGMSSYNNHLPQGGYKTWKGDGLNSNPVGITSGNIRPLTNNDMGNVFETGFGLPRPMKHYRKGSVVSVAPVVVEDPNSPGNFKEVSLINYNLNRFVKSSNGGSLVGQLLDKPGGVITKQNTYTDKVKLSEADCKACTGIGIVTNYYPNMPYLTENPETRTQSNQFCCNAQKKARKRVLPASTILKKNYYTTNAQYLQNRCRTFEQKSFNFEYPERIATADAKPGSPLALTNTYVANCQPNGEFFDATEKAMINKLFDIMLKNNIMTPTEVNNFILQGNYTLNSFYSFLTTSVSESTKAIELFFKFILNPYSGMPISGPTNPKGCKLVVYKPSNPQFAKQGAVSSSTKMLKLNVDTIQTNAASFKRSNINNVGMKPFTPFLLKYKVPKCSDCKNFFNKLL